MIILIVIASDLHIVHFGLHENLFWRSLFIHFGFNIVTAVIMKSSIFSDVTTCSQA
jgi:hypothetical protein